MKTIASALSNVGSEFVSGCSVHLRRRSWNRFAVLLLIASLVFGRLASAQSGSDDAWYTRFINSIGKSMFFCAWPTDTYDHVEFGSIAPKTGGADVSVVLYGTSWLEGRVWTEVVAVIRNGRIMDLRFGRYHALIPPGTTIRALGDTLQAINDEYKRQHAQDAPEPAPPTVPVAPLAVLCVANPTADAIAYSLPSERIASQTLAPSQVWMFWHVGSGNFTISFSGMKGSNLPTTVRVKGVMQASRPASCEANMIYDFVVVNQRVGLTPRTWIAGTESPFTPNLVRSETEGKWTCADGYKWAAPDNPNDTTCISNTTGVLGVELKIEDGVSFPKIIGVRPGAPADRAGIPPNSYLVQVNGESMQGLSIDDVVARTRGPINTLVRIGVVVPGRDQIQIFDLKRE